MAIPVPLPAMASPLRILSHRFRVPVILLAVTTDDGIDLVGSRLGAGEPAVVLCHGFLGWHRKPRVARLAESLAERFTVYAFDLRGHGQSGGACTLGDLEALDVAAAVRLARREGHARVFTVGARRGACTAGRPSPSGSCWPAGSATPKTGSLRPSPDACLGRST